MYFGCVLLITDLSGVKSTLMFVKSLGFTAKNLCPNDPAGVKCCINQSCTSESGEAGTCLNNPGPTCAGTFVTGRCPGPDDVQCCVGNSPPAPDPVPVPVPAPSDVLNVEFYIKAFIPLNVDDVTIPWPLDNSKSMIEGIPVIGDCFLTDQRDFSSDKFATARMTSKAVITIKPDSYDWSEEHFCGESTEVDCEDGEVEETDTQNNENMSFTESSGSSNSVVLDFKAARNNPLVTFSPDIDLVGTLTVDRVNKFVEFVGKVDQFPAFEAYVWINGGPPQTIQQLGPEPGAGPGSLIGDANRDFQGRVNF